jgi:hypothetical protein
MGLGNDHPGAFTLFNEWRVYELLRQGRSYYASVQLCWETYWTSTCEMTTGKL